MKDKYLMGEVCKLFNTTRDTLRYYENMGLIKPKKNDKNGYRYYDVEDLNSLTDVFFLKKLNLPLGDIHKVIKNSTPSDILEIIKEKEKQLVEEVRKIRELQKTLYSMKLNVQSCINDLNRLEIRDEKGKFIFIETTEERKFDDFIDIIEGMIDIAEGMNIQNKNILEYVNFTFLIEDGDIFNKNIDEKIKWGVTLRKSSKDIEEILLHKKVKLIYKRKCIYTVVALSDIEYNDWLQVIKDIVIKNNIEVIGPILGRMLLTEYNNDIASDYYEIFIPIK
ncbi:MerR family transcriptional regulator [Clostridium sp. D53t1_180928_C8]|uniref:MerR family transcriptional regulator n=1 Tax=Clostridium sp. D53t1_180928_C8 TaxID=2787101 RepID=UPI0018A9D066|nr:MerR family transcriptional regulator [Clostridium sp. D53t1_180928_C8]